MKWKAKDDLCGVPGKGYIKAEDFSQEDEDALVKRAKSRGVDVTQFMLGAGFVPVKGPQLEIDMDEPESKTVQASPSNTVHSVQEKTKRTRRTKSEIEADKK